MFKRGTMFLGQDKLLETLFSYKEIKNFPRTIMLVGNTGCGKHTVAHLLGERYKITVVDISDVINSDSIECIYSIVTPTLYIIDTLQLTEKNQNTLLKVLEEPPQYAYLCILCTNKNSVLPTIYNRCIAYTFEPYTKEILNMVAINNSNLDGISSIDLDTMLEYCETPGEVLSLTATTYTNISADVELLVSKLDVMLFSNIFKLSAKINFSDEYDKYDCKLFLKILLKSLYNAILIEGNKYSQLYKEVDVTLTQMSMDSRLNKEMLFEHLMTKLWKIRRQLQ